MTKAAANKYGQVDKNMISMAMAGGGGDDRDEGGIFTGDDPEERELAPPEINEVDADISFNPVLAPKEEPADNSPMKPASAASAQGNSTSSKLAKAKRKANGDDTKASNNIPKKKVKSETESKSSVEKQSALYCKSSVPPKGTLSSANAGSASAAGTSSAKAASTTTGAVTEEEIRVFLLQTAPITTLDLVLKFKDRLKSHEEKKGFADILRRIANIQKTDGPSNYVVLRDNVCTTSSAKASAAGTSSATGSTTTGAVTEEEIRAFLLQREPITTLDLVVKFKPRLKSHEDKKDFLDILRRISMIRKTNGPSNYIVLKDNICTTSSAKAGYASSTSTSSANAGSASTAGPVTEEEVRAVLLQREPITMSDLVAKFKARLKSQEEKKAFADILRRISKIQRYVVLRDK